MLTKTEAEALAVSRTEPFKSIGVDTLRHIIDDASPCALLLGDGPLFPLPTLGQGWRLWRASGMGISDWLSVFERHNLRCGQHWDDLYAREVGRTAVARAERRCLPVVYVGSRVANVFGHIGETGSFDSTPYAAPRIRVDSNRNYFSTPLKETFDRILEAYVYPPFEKVDNQATCCRLLPSAHEEHARVPWLRVLCDKRVVLPWSSPRFS